MAVLEPGQKGAKCRPGVDLPPAAAARVSFLQRRKEEERSQVGWNDDQRGSGRPKAKELLPNAAENWVVRGNKHRMTLVDVHYLRDVRYPVDCIDDVLQVL